MAIRTQQKSILDNPTVTQRAIVYARVSTDEQAENGTSIDNQIEKSLAYAAAHDMTIVGIFREDYTGKVLERPELIKVREMLRAGLADSVIVYKTNRLDRSEWGINLLLLLQEFKQLGVNLHYSQSGRKVDLNNPVEALMESISGWQAGEDHRETVTKLHEGIVQRVKSGYVVPLGDRPFGYDKVKINNRWHLQIVEKEATIIRLIFTWYVMGDETGKTYSMSAIANKLNAMGQVTRDGKEWIRSAVYSVLIGEIYCGVWHYGKISKRLENPIPVEVPTIVSRELWEQAQEQLERNKVFAQRNRKPGRYLLANRVLCGECGYRMTGKAVKANGVTYLYYQCATVDNPEAAHRRECHLPGFRSGTVDAGVWDKLEEVAGDKDKLLAGLQGYRDRQESEVEPIKRELSNVEELIKDKTAEWENAYLDLKLLTSKMAKARKSLEIDQLEQVLAGLEAKKTELLTKLEKTSLTDQQIASVVRFALQVHRAMKTLRSAEKNGLATDELRLQVFNLKRQLLELLDVKVRLFVEGGIRKGEIMARFCADGEFLSVEFDAINSSLLNRLTWVLFTDVIVL